MKFIQTFLLVSVLNIAGFSQIKNYKKGLSNFENGHYDLAIKELTKVKDIDPALEANLNQKIADAYRLSNRWKEALPYYEKSISLGTPESEALFYFAYSLKANEEYQKAKDYFQKYIDQKTTNKVLTERALRELNTVLLLEDIKSKNKNIEFKNLKSINTEGIEFSGVVLNNSLIFSSSKKDKIYSNGLPYLGIYKVNISGISEATAKPEVFSNNIFDNERNEGSPTFTPDGKTMVFARGNTGKRKDKSPDVDLYISRFVANEGWTEPKLVSASDSSAWDGSPAFSRDGKTLYFSSNRLGTNGGLDIYRVNMDASGRFGNPVNMGKAINTAGDEMFPFVSEDGRLFFASDGHPGLGKLDLFVAVRSGGKISIENMGLPYNSSMDDFGFFEDENGNQYFTSNRPGGVGQDDIYYYQAPPKPETEDDPVASKDPTKNPDPSSSDSKSEKIINYNLLISVAKNANGQKTLLDSSIVKVFKIESGLEEQTEEFVYQSNSPQLIKLEEDTDYVILAEKTGYLTKREGFTMYGRSIPQVLLKKPVTDTTFKTELLLEQIFIGKTFRLENIYYDLDKYDIRPDAAIELDKLVQILKDNPTIKIELGSHTDVRGSDLYNTRLSQRRAEAVINYLAIKGISKERLTAKGYGETELIIANAKSEEEHQVNRRTEFKVTEFITAQSE